MEATSTHQIRLEMPAKSTTSSSPFVIIIQPEGWYSFCRSVEASGLSRKQTAGKGAASRAKNRCPRVWLADERLGRAAGAQVPDSRVALAKERNQCLCPLSHGNTTNYSPVLYKLYSLQTLPAGSGHSLSPSLA